LETQEQAVMNSCKKRNLIICAYLGFLVCGLAGIATRVDAQNAAEPPVSRSDSANRPADEDLTNRIKNALHIDPYFYDKHVTVSVEKGAIVLRGFVFSAWQLQDALRIARKAAGNTLVVDNLSIKEGGR
jgi:osmotically-inducible protein OsmY